MTFKENLLTGFEDKIVHALNKYQLLNRKDFPLKQDAILFGDSLHDSYMIQKSQYKDHISVGFAQTEKIAKKFREKFDIIFTYNAPITICSDLINFIIHNKLN